MTSVEDRADETERADGDAMLRFVMTLIVATLMVAVTAYVLSYAVLAPERAGATHAAAAIQHQRL